MPHQDLPRPCPIRPTALIAAAVVWTLAPSPVAAADSASAIVYEADEVRAEAFTDCDDSAYALVTITEAGAAERYAATAKFADKIAPGLDAILAASASWLNGEGAAHCAAPVPAETITIVGLVNALPIYVTAASRSAAWARGSADPDARHIALFNPALAAQDANGCGAFDDAVAPNIGKLTTRIFTIRAAHTTGQWSHMQALTKLVPVHQDIMAQVGEWGLAWHCPGVFDLASLAILADEERTALLKWNESKIGDRIAEAGSGEELDAAMLEVYRAPSLPPVASLHDWVDDATIRYGGFLSPEAAVTEDMFAAATN